MNFWDKLTKPFFVLAPMEDVTDTVFRQILAKVGKPDVFFTEFAHVNAILHGEYQRLKFSKKESPIVAQLWGIEPNMFYQAAKMVSDMGYDGIDLNFGCPVKDVVKQGACSALIDNPPLAGEIIKATKDGAKNLPVSVKTRLGTKAPKTEDWVGFLLNQEIAALTLHGRTAKQMSSGQADWSEIAKAVAIRDRLKVHTVIIGNGDVLSLSEASNKVKNFSVDGVMIGRGIFQNVGLFAQKEFTKTQKIDLYLQHIDLFDSTWGVTKNFQILKKFAKTYIQGFTGASEIRHQLMMATSLEQLRKMLQSLEKI